MSMFSNARTASDTVFAPPNNDGLGTSDKVVSSHVHPSHIARLFELEDGSPIVENLRACQRISSRLVALLVDALGYGECEPRLPDFGCWPDHNQFSLACAAVFHRNSIRLITEKEDVAALEQALGLHAHMLALTAPGSLPSSDDPFEDVASLVEVLNSLKPQILAAWSKERSDAIKLGLRIIMQADAGEELTRYENSIEDCWLEIIPHVEEADLADE